MSTKAIVNPFTGDLQKSVDEAVRDHKRDLNFAQLAFNLASANSLTIQQMLDGFVDEYEDETGIDAGASLNESYNSALDFYKPVGADPNTKLLVHFDGTDGQTTFTDQIGTHTIVRNGDAQVDTAFKQFGTGSALFDGTGDFLSIVDHEDFNVDNGDFTIDFWMRFTATGKTVVGLGLLDSSTGVMSLDIQAGPVVNLRLSSNGTTWDLKSGTVGGSWAINTWYHIAIVRDGTDIKFFQGGTLLDTTDVSTTALHNSTDALFIGKGGDSTSAKFIGHIDEYRFSKGVARWSTNFTPPTIPYSADPTNITLISETQTASSQPDSARGIAFIEEVDALTLNTDLKFFASRDGGTTYTQGTLVNEYEYETGKDVLSASVDLSSQPAGTDMVYKYESFNLKEFNIHGTSLYWS